MGALPRGELPPGAQRELNGAIHDLHHRAGWPSLRRLAAAAGCSHTTVSKVFSTPALPSWGMLELLVEAMGGDVDHFHDLWLAASAPPLGMVSPRTRLAGRREELGAVRHHLAAGAGLLLVTGEAGIGKTTLVECAVATDDDLVVASGSCLPLSTEVPLLPVADAFRAARGIEGGRVFADAVAACPPYVADAVARLLPEMTDGGTGDSDGAISMLHLASAVTAVLAALADRRRLVLLLEDLHWADSATLDVVERLAARPGGARLVATWRLHDAHTSAMKQEWLTRISRLRGVSSIELRPLTLAETAEQVRLVTGSDPSRTQVRTIHARSAGHPLFTEQLARQGADDELPRLLVDLLDQRLGVLTGDRWAVALALGLADRGLAHPVLMAASGLSSGALTTALRDLHARRLVVASGTDARLSHPLLAEAVRRRVMPGEAITVHERLASVLATRDDGSAAEVAVHWMAAGDRAHELAWRMIAAREAAHRSGPNEEARQWLRVLELWPPTDQSCGDPPLHRTQVAFRAMHALWFAGRARQVDAMATSLLPQVGQLPAPEAAELLAIAGRTEATFRSVEQGLRLVEESVATYSSLGPSTELVLTLRQQARTLNRLGRGHEASVVLDRAWRVNREVGDVDQERLLMAERARHAFGADRRCDALEAVASAVRLHSARPDPVVDVTLAKYQTELLLEADAPPGEVLAAARRGLSIAEEHAIRTVNVAWLRHAGGCALARSGDVLAAEHFLSYPGEDDELESEQPVALTRATLDVRRGRLDAARQRAEGALAGHAVSMDVRHRWCRLLAEVELWERRPERAVEVLSQLAEELVDVDAPELVPPILTLAGRALADAQAARSERPGRSPLVEQLSGLQKDHRAAHHAAVDATWAAEVARRRGNDDIAQWTRSATEWDRIVRPHDAAYSRWRAAQAALALRHRTVAVKLLRRAARDAREHVPLSAVIAGTAAYAQGP